MRLTVVFDDNIIGIDGTFYRVELIDKPYHAIQWYGTYGEIEFRNYARPNLKFYDEKIIEPYVALWEQAKADSETNTGDEEGEPSSPEQS